jgi:Glycosyl hydrolases family 43/F5/8 type C domain
MKDAGDRTRKKCLNRIWRFEAAFLAMGLLAASVPAQLQETSKAENRVAGDFPRALIPDLIADPSVVEVDGTFYCYATTDGYGKGLSTSGPPVVWKSRDFLNWSFEGTLFAKGFDVEYWAPSTPVHSNGSYYLYPTLNGKITPVVADRLEGPYHAIDGHELGASASFTPMPITTGKPIDAEVFVDDDGQAYMVWAERGIARLKPDLVSFDGPQSIVPTKRTGYSEGPFLFKRAGIYYYLYTLDGHETYRYAYMISRVSPLGPWEAPEQDIIATTDSTQHVYGPGHGSVFRDSATDRWYFVYLEYGRSGTNRQVLADHLEFETDGTIRQIRLTMNGVGALRSFPVQPNLALHGKALASSTQPDYKVPTRNDQTLQRTETYVVDDAIDGSNGTRWMAKEDDANPWYLIDLGTIHPITRTELYFVKPTAGHAYWLEYSRDAKHWKPYAAERTLIVESPQVAKKNVRVRYLRLHVIKGDAGLWEFNIFD